MQVECLPMKSRLVFFLPLLFLPACGGGSSSQTTTTPPPVMVQTVPTTQISTDTFTNSTSQHATEVETHALGVGNTIVSTFQVARIFGGGGADIGWATSTNAGTTWTNGFLPGITTFDGGTFSAASDPVVAYDAAHAVWMISTLPLGPDTVAVSRSSDGLNWGNPITVSQTSDSDKNWIVCDNAATSPFYGHCYMEWDDPTQGGLVWMTTSTDGGLTWSAAQNSADLVTGIGGQPVVQPNGNVIVPIEATTGTNMLSFSSTNGGASWNASLVIASITDHAVAGSLRTSALPSAVADAGGTVFVVWQDCRFRTGCTSNDIVLSTSTDGNTWIAPARIPIDPTISTVDHFIGSLGIDPTTSGGSAHLGLTYYYYPVATCTSSTCQLIASFVSSNDGGITWSTPSALAGPMLPSWLPNTFAGLMVGDYVSTPFAGGKAFPIFAAATANSGSLFDEPIFTVSIGFAMNRNVATFSSVSEQPVADVHSDHPPRSFLDQEHRFPSPPAH